MATPVVVSRIQNRRGTQAQFEGLYPSEYTSASDATSTGTTVTVASTDGIYTYAEVEVVSGVGTFSPGTRVVEILSVTEFTVDLPPLADLIGATVHIAKYDGTGGCSILEYPDILLPGEVALCTDTRRIFIGNINGEYVEFTGSVAPIVVTGSVTLLPLVVELPPTPTFTVIPELTYAATPFFTILYDITDSLDPDWNTPGITFSRNGEMKITCVLPAFAPIPNLPYPPITSTNLADESVEVNTTAFDISFTTQDTGSNIEILYKHDFPTSLTFSTGSINWLPF